MKAKDQPISINGLDVVLADLGVPDAATWVTVGNVSLHIKKHDHEVTVTAYPLGLETNKPPLGELTVWFSDAQLEIEESKNEEP